MPVHFSNVVPDDDQLREWWYNSLDCCVTDEVYDKIRGHNQSEGIYSFERALQGPALDMMLRGFRIDPIWRRVQINEQEKRFGELEEILNRLAHPWTGKPLNPRSPVQLKEFFYDVMHLPQVWINQRGERKLSTGREALEKLHDYYLARPYVTLIFAIRDAGKTLGTLRSGVDPDGRMRCSYNVCGTETGRWSSSKNVYGRGTNLQNVKDRLRRMFVADPGYILVYVDGEQAESRSVGFIQGTKYDDWHYLDVCESGDLHTYVTKIVWPDLEWTGQAKADKEIAQQLFYRWFTYRDMAKRGGHGTNYYGKDYTMAKHLKVPTPLITTFQRKYLEEFPGFRKWWLGVGRQLTVDQSITTFLGRTREFFGRPNDDSTLREGIAYEPQSTVGDLVNEGGLRVWKRVPEFQMLGQIHDAYLGQVPLARVNDLVPRVMDAFQVPVTAPNGRTMTIPAEAKVGFNWASHDPKLETFSDGNPDGLRKWTGTIGTRTRVESPEASLLDRVVY